MPANYPSKVGENVADDWDPPNIIFVMLDDLGYADLGCYGGEHIQTPNVDRMADEGMRFTQCYTGSPLCAPSRSVLMTGQHTGHTRVRNNFATVGGSRVVDDGSLQRRVGLEPGDVTVAEVLSEHGYATGATGKWGLGEPGTMGVPTRKGFDTWFGFLNQRRAHTYYPPFLWHDEERVEYPDNDGKSDGTYCHDEFVTFALDFIRDQADERFFLYLPFTIPHSPYDEIPELEAYVGADWSSEERVYASMITRLDRDMGRLFDLLDELDIDEETIVFFCSDHGPKPSFGSGRFASNGPFRGGKSEITEGGLRTPMVVRWPGMISAGAVNDAPWYYADVFPTLVELAGIQPPAGRPDIDVDGISVVPTLLGEEQKLDQRYLYWECPWNGFQQAVRIEHWKAVRGHVDQPVELYDLTTDLAEERDVAAENPDVVARIEAYLDFAHVESRHWPTW